MSKPKSSSFLLTVFIVFILIFSILHSIGAQTSGMSLSGIIAVDTTWTRANGPYTLIGNLLVDHGATLAIQAGTTVNLGNYYLMINGTLQAIGSYNNQIIFNSNTNTYPYTNDGGQIIFTPFCNGYNENDSTGCIIQQATINVQLIVSNAVQIYQDTINNGINVLSQTNSLQTGTPTISYNNIKGGIMIGNTFGSALITNNNITGSSGISFGSLNPPSVTVTANTISNCGTGISVGCWGQSFNNPIQLIANNLIINNIQGINLADWESGSYPTIRDNTLTNNTVGICVSYPWGNNQPVFSAVIAGNNIYGNTKYDFQNQQPTTVDATNNWWGTTDTQAISKAIYDYYDDFKIGQVTYYPYLTSPNPSAPIYVSPTPNPTIYPSPSPTPTITSTPRPNSTTTPAPTPYPIATPTSTPSYTPPPQNGTIGESTSMHVITDQGAVVDISITGDIKSSQISNTLISVNQSTEQTIVSFTVIGQSGTEGFSNITIPKSGVPIGKTPTIYIDYLQASNQGYTQDSDNYYVWYTTHFSTHEISIVFSTNLNSTPSGMNSQITFPEIIIGVAIGLATVSVILVVLMLITRAKTSRL
jgi:hypothetical protein